MSQEKINWGLIGVIATVITAVVFLAKKNSGQTVQVQSSDGSWQPPAGAVISSPAVTPIPILQFMGDPNATQGQGTNVSIGGLSIGNPASVLSGVNGGSGGSGGSGISGGSGDSCSSGCGGCSSKKSCYASSGGGFVTSKAQLISQLNKQPEVIRTVQANLQSAMATVATSVFTPPSANIFKVTGHSTENGFSIN
jgi:hypothetical protein